MIPTSYAQSLVPDVKRILAQVDDLISMSAAFDPQQSERLFPGDGIRLHHVSGD